MKSRTSIGRAAMAGTVVLLFAYLDGFRIAGWLVGLVIGGAFLIWPGVRRWLSRMAS